MLNTHPTSVHHKFDLDCVNTFWDNGWKPTLWPIFSNCFATRGPKLGQRGPKLIQFWTFTQQMHTSNFKWTEWSFFQIMARWATELLWQTPEEYICEIVEMLCVWNVLYCILLEIKLLLLLTLDGWTDGHSPFLCSLPTSSTGTKVNISHSTSGISVSPISTLQVTNPSLFTTYTVTH